MNPAERVYEIGSRRATVLDTHRLNVGDNIGGYRIIRVRPESTREVGHVDVTKITDGNYVSGKE
jgi:hypothetical protein